MVALDNLGLLLAGIFRNASTGNGQVFNLKATNGAVYSTRIYATQGDTNRSNFDGALRQVQIGKSSTPVTRQDFKIGDPFPDSPESSLNNCIDGGYNSGLGKISQTCLISTTGGAGTITEVIKAFRIRDQFTQSGRTLIMFRDLITPENFIAGESINVEYEVLI